MDRKFVPHTAKASIMGALYHPKINPKENTELEGRPLDF
jgi:hypothetical protein